MYTEQDLTSARNQQLMRWLIVGAICLLLLGVIVFSLIERNELLTFFATLVAGAVLIFGYDMFIRPIHCYSVFLDNALHGRQHEVECVFQSADPDVSLVDGVQYYSLTVQQYDDDDKPFERLFYWDTQKPLPQLQTGDKLRIVYHDRMVSDLVRI